MMLSYFIFVPIIIVTLLYLYFTRHFNYWKNKNVPYIKPMPFFGNIYDGILMRHSMGEIFFELYYKTMSPLVGFFILDKPCLLLNDPKIIKKILITDFQNFFDRNIMSNTKDDPVSAHILFVLKNPYWKEIRTKMTPIFTASKIKSMSELIEVASHKMINYLDGQISNNSVIEMKEVCVKFTVDVITSTAFGVDVNSFGENSQFFVEAKRMFNWDNFLVGFRFRCYFLAHTLVKLFRMKLFDPKSTKFLKASFLDIMNNRALTKNHRSDLIDILLQLKSNDNHFLDGDILVAQAIMFYAAGFETSSSTMGFALHEMACNPKIQSKLRNEINDVSEKHGSINYDSVREMDYLDMCVKEVLRKYPVLPFLERKCNTRYVVPETGLVIDEDIPVFISILALHYDPKYFPNPEKFDPDRFSKNNKEQIDSNVYLPFGDGPRNCIGARFGLLTVKLGLAYILKNFIVDRCSETAENIKFNPNGVVLSALNGVNLKLQKI